MALHAHLRHQLRGRTRVALPSLRGRAEELRGIVKALLEHPSVLEARADARTATVLLFHTEDFEQIAEYALELELFELVEEPTRGEPLVEQLHAKAAAFNDQVREATGGQIDLTSIAFLVLGGSGVKQAIRGNLLPAAVTLLWNAIGVVRTAKPGTSASAAKARAAQNDVQGVSAASNGNARRSQARPAAASDGGSV